MQSLTILTTVSWACLLILSAGKGEVQQHTFKKCQDFFYEGKEPSGIVPQRAARICQMFNNKYHFATMYDRERRIPVYSAYKVQKNGTRKRSDWYIEPQLVDSAFGKNMEDEMLTHIDRVQLKRSQAVDEDYKGSINYERGHLNPYGHHKGESRNATMTFTNIVPQWEPLNKGTWNVYENNTGTRANNCDTAYVVTGVIPGNTMINERVNVPSYIWSACCCVKSRVAIQSWAAIASNNADNTKETTVTQLEKEIESITKRTVKIFPTKCARQTDDFYTDHHYGNLLGTVLNFFLLLKDKSLHILSSIFSTEFESEFV